MLLHFVLRSIGYSQKDCEGDEKAEKAPNQCLLQRAAILKAARIQPPNVTPVKHPERHCPIPVSQAHRYNLSA
jgi:hypothetical protein